MKNPYVFLFVACLALSPILLVTVLSLTGCLDPEKLLDSGVVVATHHEPESDGIVMIPVIVGKFTSLSPRPVHNDEYWSVTIAGQVAGKEKTRTLYVDQEVYEKLSIGDAYS